MENSIILFNQGFSYFHLFITERVFVTSNNVWERNIDGDQRADCDISEALIQEKSGDEDTK